MRETSAKKVQKMSLNDVVGKKYKMVYSENFEDYLKEIGMGWPQRKLAKNVAPTVELVADGEDYILHSYTSVRNSTSRIGTRPDFEYEYEAPDGRMVKSTYTINAMTIHEVQKDAKGRIVFIERRFSDTEFYMVIKIGKVTSTNLYKII